MGKDEKSALLQIIEGAAEDGVGAAVVRMAEGGEPESVVGAAAIGALRGASKKGAAALARLLAESKTRRELAEAVGCEVEEHLKLVAPIVEQNAERLLEDPDVRRKDLASNTAAILVGWERAYRATGDAKKRRVIMAALGNAFQPKLFKEGLTLRLFGMLEQLDYPEIRFLRTAFGPEGHIKSDMVHRSNVKFAEGTETREHLERLKELRLVGWRGAWDSTPNAGEFIKYAKRTWLGDQLLALCEDTEALSQLWPDPAEGAE